MHGLKLCGKFITSLPCLFFYSKSLFKIAFWAEFFNCQPIFIFLQHIVGTNKVPNIAKKIFCLPLSETRNHTLTILQDETAVSKN